MPRQKNAPRPINSKTPAMAADGTNPPTANEEKWYI